MEQITDALLIQAEDMQSKLDTIEDEIRVLNAKKKQIENALGSVLDALKGWLIQNNLTVIGNGKIKAMLDTKQYYVISNKDAFYNAIYEKKLAHLLYNKIKQEATRDVLTQYNINPSDIGIEVKEVVSVKLKGE